MNIHSHKRRKHLRGAVPTPSEHHFKPLAGPELRLLEIKPSNGAVGCRLRHSPLHSSPRYVALSYVWGDAASTRLIKVDGRCFAVTQNLYSGLLRLRAMLARRDLPPRTLFWIDAICVNQRDADEKSAQVPRMGDIYRSAAQVVIWLSTDKSTARIEAEHMREILAPVGEGEWGELQEARKKGYASVEDDVAILALHLSFDRFVEHPWFSRTWTLQEAVMARESPVFVCGDGDCGASITLDALAEKAEMFRGNSDVPLLRILILRDMVGPDYPVPENSGLSLIWLLKCMCTREASVIQDRVYGCYGIFQALHCNDTPLPTPDYNLPEGQIFADIARLIVQRTGRSFVLNTAMVKRRLKNTPTWASDLRHAYGKLGKEPGPPPEDPEHWVRVSDDGRTLSIKAALVGRCISVLEPPADWAGDYDLETIEPRVHELIADFECRMIGPLARRRGAQMEDVRRSILSQDSLLDMYERFLRGTPQRYNVEDIEAFTDLRFLLFERSVFVTDTGLVGIAHEDGLCRIGDSIFLRVDGGPICLRKAESCGAEQYEVIGPIDICERGLRDPAGKTFGYIDLI
ncbi:heterokaryon incompatibility protein [Colletotrichum plurivorum]|uniref:Heterokaryon incompatibility protein n=1 Tax=Colletotrichum plurivorum TaxID=2175906 RepID=A0A8H6JFY8_9PEZI|nr:heterokaryon incompatibility protein [Colletotrichum plurivorum]